jgi:SAM-dependent methyltransferase
MNRAEKAVLNNPARRLLQRTFEAPALERHGGRVRGGDVLEVGCGVGGGTRLLLERFEARHVDAVDLDPEQVRRAAKRLRGERRVVVGEGDVTSLPAEDARYDAVFDVGVLHHVPVWQDGLAEIARVLRPGGVFFFEEVTQRALERWTYRTFFEHPTDNRFTPDGFTSELHRHGLRLLNPVSVWWFGDFVLGAAVRDG